MNRSGVVRSLQHGERKALLVALDGALLAGSVAVALWRWTEWDPTRSFELRWLWAVPVWLLALELIGCYDLRTAGDSARITRALAWTTALVLGLYTVVYFFAPPESLPRSVVLLQIGLAALALAAWRAVYSSLLTRSRFRRRVLVIGSGPSASEIATTIARDGSSTYEMVGPVPGARPTGPPASGTGGLDGADLVGAVASYGASEVVVAVDHALSADDLATLLVIQERGVQITPMPLLYEALTGRVPIEHLGSNWWTTLPLDHPQTRSLYLLAKRTLDLAIAIPSLFVFGILLPVLVAAIKVDSRGSAFYRQQRVGKHGRDFSIVKLRTMIVDAEPEGHAVWATQRDPRITRTGRILRATMLDEIPQLWNVLKGEMSIVGPRPERPELVAQLEARIPYYRLRHAALPGMAGWSLLHEGYAGTTEKAVTKLEYDLYYIKHQSLLLDLRIVLRTLGRALTFRRSERKLKGSEVLR